MKVGLADFLFFWWYRNQCPLSSSGFLKYSAFFFRLIFLQPRFFVSFCIRKADRQISFLVFSSGSSAYRYLFVGVLSVIQSGCLLLDTVNWWTLML